MKLTAACLQRFWGRSITLPGNGSKEMRENLRSQTGSRFAGGTAKWLLGTGLLSLDATLFGFSAIILVSWNLISQPSDIWVDTFLLRWAFFLGLHALLVIGLQVSYRLFRLGVAEKDSAVSSSVASAPWPVVQRHPAPVQAVPPDASRVEMAEDWARKWLQEQGNLPSTAASGSHAYPETEPVQLAMLRISPGDPVVRRDPAAGWPTVKPVTGDVQPEEAPALVDLPAPVGVDPLRQQLLLAGDQDRGETGAGDMDWRWVEAAASAWLARRQEEAAGLTPMPTGKVVSRPAGRPEQDVS